MSDTNILELAKKIEYLGGRVYLVGGSVRDCLLNISSADKDYVVTGLDKNEFLSVFKEAIPRGKSFEVYDLYDAEFALARTESKVGVGHKEFEVKTGKDISLEQDLARRDITINSIAKDVLTGEIIDPYNGIKDLENRIIRATTTKFKEDPLRVYRVARFAASLEFDVDENTLEYMNSLKSELLSLSNERVFVEFKKALLSNKPSIFFEVLKKANVLDVHFKEIYDLIGAIQPIEFHPEGDAYNHTLLVVDKACTYTQDPIIRYSALVHDLGKGITPKSMYPHHYEHDVNGVKLVTNLSKRIGVPKNWESSGKTAAGEHMKGGIFYKLNPKTKVAFIEKVSKSHLGLHGLQIVVNSDKLSSREDVAKQDINFEDIGNRCLTEIDGKYIEKKYNLKQGIEFGNKLYQERIEWMKKDFF